MKQAYGHIPRKRRLAETTQVIHFFNEPLDMSRVRLKRRLAIADEFVAVHPGRPIAALLLDLFPELDTMIERKD